MEPAQTNVELVTPDTVIETTYYIDLRRGPLQLARDYCILEQGKHPCMGDLRKPCCQRFEGCSYRRMCMDEIGGLQYRLGELPDYIQTFTAKWLPETYELRGKINDGAARRHIATGARDIDMNRRTLLFIQYLLKGWDLDLSLEFEPIKGMQKWNQLKQTTMQQIGTLPGDFIEQLVERAVVQSRGFDTNIFAQAKLYFNGGDADNEVQRLNVFRTLWKEYGIAFAKAKLLPADAIDKLLAIVGAEAEVIKEKMERK